MSDTLQTPTSPWHHGKLSSPLLEPNLLLFPYLWHAEIMDNFIFVKFINNLLVGLAWIYFTIYADKLIDVRLN